MGKREEQKRKTRRAILDAAIELSARRGFSGISLREVTAKAGVTAPSFYRHFTNLEEVGLALVDEIGLSLRELIRDARRQVDREQASVTRASIETFMDYLNKNGDLFRLFLGESSGSYPSFRLAIQKEVNRFIDDLSDDLRVRGERKGRPAGDTKLLAEAMTIMVFHMGSRALDIPQEQQDELTEKIIAQVRLIMRGAEAEYAHHLNPGE